jgi:hypothetical protein
MLVEAKREVGGRFGSRKYSAARTPPLRLRSHAAPEERLSGHAEQRPSCEQPPAASLSDRNVRSRFSSDQRQTPGDYCLPRRGLSVAAFDENE